MSNISNVSLVQQALQSGVPTTLKDLQIATGLTKSQTKNAMDSIRKSSLPGVGTGNNPASIPSPRPILPIDVPPSLREIGRSTFGEEWQVEFAVLMASAANLSSYSLSSLHPDNRETMVSGVGPVRRNLSRNVITRLLESAPFHPLISEPMVNEPRTLYQTGFPKETLAALIDDTERVNAFTGEPLELVPVETRPGHFGLVEKFRQKLNAQEYDYSPVLARRARALEYISDSSLRRTKKLCAVSALSGTVRNPKPQYSSGHNSLRLFAQGNSFQNLMSEVRDVSFAGFVKLDLASCHLAILATNWQSDILQSYLSGNVWERLVEETGLTKGVLKTLVYRLSYGGSIYGAEGDVFKESNITEDDWEQILAHPLIRELILKCSSAMDRIKGGEVLSDAFGRPLVVSSDEEAQTGQASESDVHRAKTRRTLLAARNQSFELRMLIPVVDYLMDNGVPIPLWAHDGFIIPGDTPQHLITEAQNILSRIASELDINTRLEQEVILPPELG